jgi:hypothetical protein
MAYKRRHKRDRARARSLVAELAIRDAMAGQDRPGGSSSEMLAAGNTVYIKNLSLAGHVSSHCQGTVKGTRPHDPSDHAV